jgi:hypothetical protein
MWNLFNQFAKMFGTPTWDTIRPIPGQQAFRERLIKTHRCFKKYKESPELFTEMGYGERSRM